MKNDSPASRREMSEHVRERAGDRCEACGAVHGAMITLGVHIAEPKGALEQPKPAWLDHWSGNVHARDDGDLLELGRFMPSQSPMKVVLKPVGPGQSPVADDAQPRLLCQWHYLSHHRAATAEGDELCRASEEGTSAQ